MAALSRRKIGRQRSLSHLLRRAWLANLAFVATACGSASPAAPRPSSDMRVAAVQAVDAITRSFVSDLNSHLASDGGSYQPCSLRALSFYSRTATITAKAGTSVADYQGEIVPELRGLGWTVTVVDVATLHTFGGPVRHPIDRIRRGSLFGAVNVVDIAGKAETVLFINTKCFRPNRSA